MKKLPHFFLAIGLLLTLCSCTNGTSDSAGQQAASDPSSDEVWPASAINLVVPASAGGGTDSNARVVAKYLTDELGVPVNIVNIGGASGVTGCTEVLNATTSPPTMRWALPTSTGTTSPPAAGSMKSPSIWSAPAPFRRWPTWRPPPKPPTP